MTDTTQTADLTSSQQSQASNKSLKVLEANRDAENAASVKATQMGGMFIRSMFAAIMPSFGGAEAVEVGILIQEWNTKKKLTEGTNVYTEIREIIEQKMTEIAGKPGMFNKSVTYGKVTGYKQIRSVKEVIETSANLARRLAFKCSNPEKWQTKLGEFLTMFLKRYDEVTGNGGTYIKEAKPLHIILELKGKIVSTLQLGENGGVNAKLIKEDRKEFCRAFYKQFKALMQGQKDLLIYDDVAEVAKDF